MSLKRYTVKLTQVQIDHIRTLLQMAIAEGCYFGNKAQYWDRHKRIDQILQAAGKDE